MMTGEEDEREDQDGQKDGKDDDGCNNRKCCCHDDHTLMTAEQEPSESKKIYKIVVDSDDGKENEPCVQGLSNKGEKRQVGGGDEEREGTFYKMGR